MQMKDNLVNFLYDLDYFISLYDGFIHVFNYKELEVLHTDKVVLKLDGFKVTIKGTDLFVVKMLPNEILIKGNVLSVGKVYE